MIDHVKKIIAKRQPADYGLGYVYFDYKDQDQQTPRNILRCLLKQLARLLPDLPQEVEAFHKGYMENGEIPTLDDLFTAILAVSKQFSNTFFVFDALDECDPEMQRKQLLPLFHKMVEGGINVFLTSRPGFKDIQHSLQDSAKIELAAKKQDIDTFIRARIDENPEARRLVLQGRCQDQIISDLTDCAQGM